MKLLFLLAVLMALCVAGCSKTKPKVDTSDTSTASSPSSEAPTDQARDSDEPLVDPSEELTETIDSLGFPLELKYTRLEQKNLPLHTPKGEKSLPAQVYYSRSGSVLRVQSLLKDTTTLRMPPQTIQKNMLGNKEEILAIVNDSTEEEFFSAWKSITDMYVVSEADEFILTSVNYKFRELGLLQIYVLELRGYPNPLGITRDLPSKVKDRARIFFRKDGSFLGGDNML